MSQRLASGFTRYASRVVPAKSFPLDMRPDVILRRRFRTHQPAFSLACARRTFKN